MATRVHSTSITGSLGEDQASVAFGKIRWAPPVKLRQDIGTDLVTFARGTAAPDDQADAYDLGAPVFMQVKGSPSEYRRPSAKRNGEQGWWFAESETYHFDHWLSFGLPYLLVLVDTSNDVAYWAEVNGRAIVSTGKGRKIFVPHGQRVDADSLDALNKIAVSRRKYALEGVAWTGKLNELGPADRLRYALVMPRLVAPHPNLTVGTLTSEEAAAMLMRNRRHELGRRPDSQDVCPPQDTWATHKEWGWRFVHALDELLTTGSSARFVTLAGEARHRYERDACIVIHACVLHTDDQTEHALEHLKASQNTKPADRGWLLAQRAALMLELDMPDDAARAAQAALLAMSALDGDLTVSAIRGGAASVLYSTAGRTGSNLADAISAQDNAGNWWRAQDVSWALAKDLEHRFKSWSDSNTVTITSSSASGDLSTAAWNAAFTASWGAWRHLTDQVAQLVCTSRSDAGGLGAALTLLVLIGEKESARRAARKMWLDGPIDAVATAVRLVTARRWLKRDEGAVMSVLAEAGDLLTAKEADAAIDRIFDTLRIDGDVRRHAGGASFRWVEVGATVPRLLRSASLRSHRACMDLICDKLPEAHDGVADALVRIGTGLALDQLSATRARKLASVASARDDHYGLGLLEVIGSVSNDALVELRRRAEAGDAAAGRALLVVGSDDRGDYLRFGRSAARTVNEMIAAARGTNGRSSFATYASDQLHDLALAALRTADAKLWKTVTDALEAGILEESQVQKTVRMLARQFPGLPPHVKRKLRKIIPNLRAVSLPMLFGGPRDFEAAATHLRIAAGIVSDADVEATLLQLRYSDPRGFVNTLASWNGEQKFPFLASMIFDPSPHVRGQVVFSLLEHAHRFPADEQRAVAMLQTALSLDRGCCSARAAAQGINAFPSEALEPLAAALRQHPSSIVRSYLSQTDD